MYDVGKNRLVVQTYSDNTKGNEHGGNQHSQRSFSDREMMFPVMVVMFLEAVSDFKNPEK